MLSRSPIDNSALFVPPYPDADPPQNAVFPCSTKYMKYDKRDHRYYATVEGFQYYDIEIDESNPRRDLKTPTEHIYSYIALMAQTKYNLMCYRIAHGYFGRYKSFHEGRAEFERMLYLQADFIAEFGDAKRTPKVYITPESGRMKEQVLDAESGYWLHDEVLTYLNATHLTDPNATFSVRDVDWSTY